EHTPWDAPNNLHPNVEHVRRNLVVAVETAESESFGRQARLGACQFRCIRTAFAVGRQEAVRKMYYLLLVEFASVAWNDDRIGDYVVDVCRAHCREVAEITDLNRRRPPSKDPRS